MSAAPGPYTYQTLYDDTQAIIRAYNGTIISYVEHDTDASLTDSAEGTAALLAASWELREALTEMLDNFGCIGCFRLLELFGETDRLGAIERARAALKAANREG